jgi:diamine N-acetyltransferase
MSAITLREVNKDNLKAVFRLRVKPDQGKFVASNTQSIAEAHFSEEAWFRAIYADDEPVGFVMLSIAPEKAEYFLWRFMIDAKHQSRGYGRRSLELVIDYVRSLPNATAFYLSHAEGEGSPAEFYSKLGFRHTGEVEDDELVMKLEL